MRRFLLQNSVCSLIFLFLVSCKANSGADIKTDSISGTTVENLYFSSTEDYIYKCQMDIYNNHVSGILIVKKIREHTHRIVFTSDFGNKLIDFEISENDFKLNYVLPDLDKKIVIGFLKNDFQRLLKKKYLATGKVENDSSITYVAELDKKNYSYLVFNKGKNNLLQSISFRKKNKEKILYIFDGKKPTFAETIEIQHQDYKINIKLFQITENEEE